jgi:hypothetical protein
MMSPLASLSRRRPLGFLLSVLIAACSSPPSAVGVDDRLTTGLEGVVQRGPVQPVCRVGEPCDAPFRWTFEVWRRQQHVARFQSNSMGRYTVHLAPGDYSVVADSGAPLWPPQQALAVTVGPVGLTHLDLDFDTGIR